MHRFFFILLIIGVLILSVAICFWLDIPLRGAIPIFPILLVLFSSLAGRYYQKIGTIFNLSISLLRMNLVLISTASLFLIVKIVLLFVSYDNYSKDSDSYVLSEEIRAKQAELSHKNIGKEIQTTAQARNLIETEVRDLNYISSVLDSAKKRNHSLIDSIYYRKMLFVNDSIILDFNTIQMPPGGSPAFSLEVFDNRGMLLSKFYFSGTFNYFEGVTQRIEDLNGLLRENDNIDEELRRSFELNKWSLVTFLSFYYNDEIQPMTRTTQILQIVDRWLIAPFLAYFISTFLFSRITRP